MSHRAAGLRPEPPFDLMAADGLQWRTYLPPDQDDHERPLPNLTNSHFRPSADHQFVGKAVARDGLERRVPSCETGFGDPDGMGRSFMRTLGHPQQTIRRVARQAMN